jgi:predicted NUDIX family NTP pyrophosphohydrolase
VESGRAGQDQSADAFWVPKGVVDRKESSERVADQNDRLIDSGAIEGSINRLGQLGDRANAIGSTIAFAVQRELDCNRAVILGKGVHRPGPMLGGSEKSMKENDNFGSLTDVDERIVDKGGLVRVLGWEKAKSHDLSQGRD